ncbi:uncharacterized protein LOC131435755 [Malaya genurostris]|uniref:uncharacterized protein LOC131435755 n=1 Tax=Malaya genurostris TaxID=325434 RepID=UPI0026F3F64B|nr:uncharacterized protein LOC131435755 [Malaya genurostris]
MNVMATKMKASTTDFLSGDGIDLNPQKKLTSISSQEQDDLDLLLSEITVQFDDEVQTLYVGPVEIVDDDDDDDDDGGNGGGCNVPTSKNNKKVALEPITPKKVLDCIQKDEPLPTLESNDDDGVDDDGCNVLTSKNNEAALKPITPKKLLDCIQKVEPLPTPESDDVTKGDASVQPLVATVATDETNQANAEHQEKQLQHQQPLPPPPEVQDAVVGEEPVVEAAIDSANDDRPHHLTEAAVVIDPKNGGASQTVLCADLTESKEKDKRETSPEKAPPVIVNVTTRVTRSASSPVKPPAVITPTSPPNIKNKLSAEPEEQPKSSPERASKRLRVKSERTTGPTAIKEEIKQLSPVLPPSAEEETAVEPVEAEESTEEEETFQKQEREVIIEADQPPQEEDEEETPEGELIVPDVVPPEQENEERLLEYNAPYNKETSSAGSDSGIENETTELNKVVLPSGEDERQEVESCAKIADEPIAEDIPESVTDAENSAQVIIVHDNTQEKGVEESVKPTAKSGIKIIKCAECVMTFKKELWYKKHLMNYHGIDLSNIAHFLSNLQTLDEGIQDEDGNGVEEEFQQFQLTDGAHSSNDKTDGNHEEIGHSGQELEEPAVKKLRRSVPSTPSPATLQMYPEVKLSTVSNGKTKAGRRRKDKLIPRNSDADMRIKHEYHSVTVHPEEPAGGSTHSSQLNNVFVVTYLEQAAFVAGGGSTVLPGSNKENSKSSPFDPLDDLTPFERAKIIENGTEDKRIYACSICGTEFDQRMEAQDHVNYVHKDVKRRSCPHCGRTFTQTGDLTRHVRIHTGIRPFKCPVDGCKYAFISSGDLHKHVRRHNQLVNPIPKPHVCTSCGKDFERGYDLKRHSSMHAKDDPNYQGFNCELCGKTFARKDQYRAHTYRHIGYKPHKCTQCYKSFSDASNYAKHLKVHAMDGMSLICHFCDKPFKNKMAISKHVFHCKYKPVKREIVKQESS